MIHRIKNFLLFIKENYEIENRIITLDEVLKIHEKAIKQYGGVRGIRSLDQLKSALDKPYMSAFGKDLYSTIFMKTAAIFESIIVNHPFSDGNKRTAFMVMRHILKNAGLVNEKNYDSSRRFIVNIIEKRATTKSIANWIRRYSGKV